MILPPLDAGNISLALLRDPAVIGGESAQGRADLLQQYDVPRSSAGVHLSKSSFRLKMGAAQFVGGKGEISQFAVTPNQEACM